MGHNRNLADYAHHFDGTHIDLGSGNIETQGVLTYEDVTNVDAIGIITARAGVKVPDSQNISLGTGNDFAITHDGTNTTFINDTGQIQIRNRADDQDIILQTDDGSGGVAVYLRCDGSSGQVDLNHYGSRKLYTSSTGATVNGTLVSDSVTSELDLSAISSSISDTATDIFVYDTRKDSDGGAWRKRTQHTSWYNETLNTSTRGSRKEFPAVAVIVAKGDDTITIYDGDNPDLPMWMVMPVLNGWDSTTKVSALNGIIVMTNHGYNGTMFHVKFIEDSYNLYDSRASVSHNSYTSRISDRATVASYSGTQISNIRLVHADINDVAMTVLPNAPIDSATGLPTPTIALATDGGVSIIKDDGSVIDYTHQNAAYDITSFVEFLGDNRVAYAWDNDTTPRRLFITPVRSSDTATVTPTSYPIDTVETVGYGRPTDNKDVGNYHGHLVGHDQSVAAGMNGSMLAVGDGSDGLNLVDVQAAGEDTFNSRIAFISKDYNTGWQYGNIKGTFLSDTTVESFSPSNLVTEDFSANWTGATNGVLSVSSGQLTITNSGGGNGRAISNTFATTSGKKYALIVKAVSNSSATYRLEVRGPELVATGTTNGQTLVIYFDGTGNSSTFVELYAIGSSGASATYEDAYVVELEEDRSVNNKGLQVFGTVTKSAVATGADLVAYSGFSASNHLAQPYNSDLNPGSGSYSVVAWFKTESNNSGSGAITGLGNGDTDEVMLIYVNSSYGIYFDYGTSTEYVYLSNSNDRSMVRDGNWHQVVCQVTAGQVGEIYIDGIKKSTAQNVAAPSTWSQWDTNYRLYVGCGRGLGTLPFSGSISLVRYSLSKMSTEQIKKIYEDEKVLFQENAKCTLYSDGTGIAALAYDEDTELLHVGTSSGRSDFQGLRRINNTTTAVTTAISASDELIAEQ